MRNTLLIVTLGMLALAAGAQEAKPGPAAKEVYRWTDKDGVVHYTDKPPSRNAEPAKLPPLQTYKPEKAAPPTAAAAKPVPAAAAAAGPAVAILTPAADETLRDAAREVTISVEIKPPTVGAQLIYFLDGEPLMIEPTVATTFTAAGVERGSHTAEVAVIGPDGREVSRSPAVTFHSKPPIVPKPAPQPVPK